MVIRVSASLRDLTGQGLEYLIASQDIIAVFYNGNLTSPASRGNTDVTLASFDAMPAESFLAIKDSLTSHSDRVSL